MKVDYSSLIPTRQPTKAEKRRFNGWVKYLTNSRLSKEEVYRRAESFTNQKLDVPKE